MCFASSFARRREEEEKEKKKARVTHAPKKIPGTTTPRGMQDSSEKLMIKRIKDNRERERERERYYN